MLSNHRCLETVFFYQKKTFSNPLLICFNYITEFSIIQLPLPLVYCYKKPLKTNLSLMYLITGYHGGLQAYRWRTFMERDFNQFGRPGVSSGVFTWIHRPFALIESYLVGKRLKLWMWLHWGHASHNEWNTPISITVSWSLLQDQAERCICVCCSVCFRRVGGSMRW